MLHGVVERCQTNKELIKVSDLLFIVDAEIKEIEDGI